MRNPFFSEHRLIYQTSRGPEATPPPAPGAGAEKKDTEPKEEDKEKSETVDPDAEAATRLGEANTKVKELQDAVKKTQQEIDQLKKKVGKGSLSAEQQRQLDDLNAKLNEQTQAVADAQREQIVAKREKRDKENPPKTLREQLERQIADAKEDAKGAKGMEKLMSSFAVLMLTLEKFQNWKDLDKPLAAASSTPPSSKGKEAPKPEAKPAETKPEDASDVRKVQNVSAEIQTQDRKITTLTVDRDAKQKKAAELRGKISGSTGDAKGVETLNTELQKTEAELKTANDALDQANTRKKSLEGELGRRKEVVRIINKLFEDNSDDDVKAIENVSTEDGGTLVLTLVNQVNAAYKAQHHDALRTVIGKHIPGTVTILADNVPMQVTIENIEPKFWKDELLGNAGALEKDVKHAVD